MIPAPVCRAEFVQHLVRSRVVIVRKQRLGKERPLTILSFKDNGTLCVLSSRIAEPTCFRSEEELLSLLTELGLSSIKLPVRVGQAVTYMSSAQRDSLMSDVT